MRAVDIDADVDGAQLLGDLHRPFVMTLGDGQHFFLDLIAPDASIHSVPLHRVRAVWRDGVRIWERASPHTDGR